MKKLFIVALALGVLGISSAFARNYGAAGCGLGSMVFGTQPGMVQVLAATTNGATGTQTFGISTGTLNCEPDYTAAAYQKLPVFVEANHTTLPTEMSRGTGDTLWSLSSVLGCKDTSHFGTVMQQNVGRIYPTENPDPMTVSGTILQVIKQDPNLSKDCSV